jgi:ICE2
MAGSVYFLNRIWNFPSIGRADALLIGIALAAAVILCSYAVVSGRGTIPESALLVLPNMWKSNSLSLPMLSSIYTVRSYILNII